MSNSTEKMDVVMVESPWKAGVKKTKVVLKKSRVFYPSFEDLFRIAQMIGKCEEWRYPDGEGRNMVARFLYDAAMADPADFDKLRKKYRIPERDGTEVVNDNGADLAKNFSHRRSIGGNLSQK